MKRLIVLLVCSVLFIACGEPGPEVTALDDARTRWEAASIGSYRYTIARFCFCPLVTQTVTVANGEVVSVEAAPGSQGVGDGLTIEQLFDELDGILESPQRGELTADYDAARGFPAAVTADPYLAAIDDEFSYTITGFEVLSG